jgi:hypothetical protein
MIHRASADLNVLTSRTPSPSLEVLAESVEASGSDVHRVAAVALASFAAMHPSCRASVYVYGTMGVNFHAPGWSEFLIPVGDPRLMGVLQSAFAMIPGARKRVGDYVAPSQGLIAFHLEEGRLWRPEDAVTFYSEDGVDDGEPEDGPNGEAQITAADERQVVEPADLTYDLESADTGGGADESSTAKRSSQPTRFRQARADARVGTIRQEIERVFGLPAGSVVLRGVDGRPLRADALIRTLRARWADE